MNKILKYSISVLLIFGCLSVGVYIGTQLNVSETERSSTETIAVVNLDEGSDYNGESRNFGVELLNVSDSNFTVTGLSDAQQGVESGNYAAYIILPSTLSKDVISINTVVSPITFTYEVSGKLTENAKENAIINIAEFEKKFNFNLSNMYISSILNNYHNAQNNAKVVLNNDNTDLDVISSINSYDLIDMVEVTQVEILENTIEDLDIEEESQKAETIIQEIDETYKNFMLLSAEELQSIKSDYSNHNQNLNSLKTAIQQTPKIIDDEGNKNYSLDSTNTYIEEVNNSNINNIAGFKDDVASFFTDLSIDVAKQLDLYNDKVLLNNAENKNVYNELVNANNTISKYNVDVDVYNNEVNSHNHTKDNYVGKTNSYIQEVSNFKTMVNEYQGLTNETSKNQNDTIEELKTEVEQLESKIEELEEDAIELEELNNSQAIEIKDLNEKNAEQTIKIDALIEKENEKDSLIQSYQKFIDDLKDEVNNKNVIINIKQAIANNILQESIFKELINDPNLTLQDAISNLDNNSDSQLLDNIKIVTLDQNDWEDPSISLTMQDYYDYLIAKVDTDNVRFNDTLGIMLNMSEEINKINFTGEEDNGSEEPGEGEDNGGEEPGEGEDNGGEEPGEGEDNGSEEPGEGEDNGGEEIEEGEDSNDKDPEDNEIDYLRSAVLIKNTIDFESIIQRLNDIETDLNTIGLNQVKAIAKVDKQPISKEPDALNNVKITLLSVNQIPQKEANLVNLQNIDSLVTRDLVDLSTALITSIDASLNNYDEYAQNSQRNLDTLNIYDPHTYIEEKEVERSVGKIQRNQSAIIRKIEEKNREFESFTRDVHRNSYDHIDAIRKDLSKSTDASNKAVESGLKNLKETKDTHSKENEILLNELITSLLYTRNESLLNTQAVDFIAHPVSMEGEIHHQASVASNNLPNTALILSIVFGSIAVLALLINYSLKFKKKSK